jgi:tight adherence protein B
MNDVPLMIFTITIFAAVFFLIVALGFIRTDHQERNLIRKRLMVSSAEMIPQSEFNLLRDSYRSHLCWFDRWLIRLPGLERHIDYANYSGSIRVLRLQALLALVLLFFFSFLAFSFSGEVEVALGIGILSGFSPFLRLNWLAEKRLQAFETQLPEALEAITRALRAGYPLLEAMKMIAEEMSDPLSSEFKTVFDEINAGVDMRSAFLSLRSRVPSVSLMAFTTSVLLQRETGGNLTETLSKISLIIRKRFTFERNVKTLTAEGRMSAWVLGLLPIGLYVMFYIMNPEYASLLFTDPQGRKVSLMGFAFLLGGSLWLRRIIRADL